MSKLDQYVKPITKEAALEVAYNLRPDDLVRGRRGSWVRPIPNPPQSGSEGSAVYFIPDGKTAGLAGVGDGGEIWMLYTPAIHRYPITFAREAKRWVDSRTELYCGTS